MCVANSVERDLWFAQFLKYFINELPQFTTYARQQPIRVRVIIGGRSTPSTPIQRYYIAGIRFLQDRTPVCHIGPVTQPPVVIPL